MTCSARWAAVERGARGRAGRAGRHDHPDRESEELHNNHHAYAASAKLSSRPWEFDLGWAYIRALEMLHVAKVRKVAPALRTVPPKPQCDTETVHAVVRHRFAVLAGYARSIRQTARTEIESLRKRASPDIDARKAMAAIRHWLRGDAAELPALERQGLDRVLDVSPVLQTLYAMRQELAALWGRSPATPEQLARQLEDWCQRAEASGIAALRQFSMTVRSYA